MLYPLGLINSTLGNPLESIQVIFVYYQVHWPQFPIPYFHLRVFENDFFRYQFLLFLGRVC